MDLIELKKAIENKFGIFYHEDKNYLLKSRVSDVMLEYNLQSYDKVAEQMYRQNDHEFLDKIANCVTTRETFFFRNPNVYNVFFSDVLTTYPKDKPIKIWSAGCSTGQEPYSIAMGISEKYPHQIPNISIIGSDISPEAIAKAKKGIYTEFELSRGLSEHQISSFFTKSDRYYQISESIQTIVSFKKENLLQINPRPFFDIIFFQNVAIYFKGDFRRKIIQNISNYLVPGGVLIIGSSENLSDYLSEMKLVKSGMMFFYRKEA
ncbi:MAG: protein-glutamate O-methyltransferase CheR [Leptospirales bacterium]